MESGVFPVRDTPSRRMSASGQLSGMAPSSCLRVNSTASIMRKYSAESVLDCLRRPSGMPLRAISRCSSMWSSSPLHRSTVVTFVTLEATRTARIMRLATSEVTTRASSSAAFSKMSYTSRSLFTKRKITRLVGQDWSMHCSNCPSALRTVFAALSPVQSEITKMGLVRLQLASGAGASFTSGSCSKLDFEDAFGATSSTLAALSFCTAATRLLFLAPRERSRFLSPARFLGATGAGAGAGAGEGEVASSRPLAAISSRFLRIAIARAIASFAAASAATCSCSLWRFAAARCASFAAAASWALVSSSWARALASRSCKGSWSLPPTNVGWSAS
mmetsp:Transcript_27690/g.52705  ORF Transcript_27690/g.52705 Transcript_27690/m.52705 type:complete len:333 (+) Transcript_27690:411-1409(+)